jgi:hypothetical protein
MQRVLALCLSVALALPACASSGGMRAQSRGQIVAPGADRSILADFAQQLPAGTRVRATMTDHRRIRGTLMKATSTSIFIQPRTRVPEPVVEVRFDQLLALEQETSNGGTGRAVAIGAAAGAGAALGVLLLLAAIFAD